MFSRLAPLLTLTAVISTIPLPVTASPAEAPTSECQQAALMPRPRGLAFRRSLKPSPAPRVPLAASPKPTTTAPPAPTPSTTPRPLASPIPAARATRPPAPSPQPSATASPAVEEVVPDIAVRVWGVPSQRSASDTTYQPAWRIEGTLWQRHWGFFAGLTVFGQTYAPFRPSAYFETNTTMTDAVLAYRSVAATQAAFVTHYSLFGGYRGIGLADVNFGTLGGSWEQAIGGSGLAVRARVQAGYGQPQALFAEGRLAIALRWLALGAEVGVRDLALQLGNEPLFNLLGPEAALTLSF